MKRDELGDLVSFLAVCEERSFTKAAARLGTSQSSLSHTIKRLEEHLGIRLLTRTTRNVAPTLAGEKLATTLRPALDMIDTQLASLDEMKEKPAGLVRLTVPRRAAMQMVWPKLHPLLRKHPDIKLEISVDHRMTDIVEERFDAGVRLGESVEKDMIAVKMGPEMRLLTLGTPEYFKKHGRPKTPHDLTDHNCINLRLPTLGGLYAWEYDQDGKPLNVRVDGQLTTDDPDLIVEACLDGVGLCCLPDYHLNHFVEEGRLESVLDDWSSPFSGYYLYYPSRRQNSSAFSMVLEALRYRS